MIEPGTYYDTTKSGRRISETAKDANSVVDYPSIKAAGDKVKDVARSSVKKIVKNIEAIQAGKETLSVNDKTLKPVIDEMGNYIKKLPSMGIDESIDSAVEYAEERHDEFQREFNEEAEAKVKRRAASEE